MRTSFTINTGGDYGNYTSVHVDVVFDEYKWENMMAEDRDRYLADVVDEIEETLARNIPKGL